MEKIQENCNGDKMQGLIREILINRNNTHIEFKNKNEYRNELFNKIINLINEKNVYMLGPEKTKVAMFIVDNIIDLYEIIKPRLEDL